MTSNSGKVEQTTTPCGGTSSMKSLPPMFCAHSCSKGVQRHCPSPVTCYRCHCRGHLSTQCYATLRNSYGGGGGSRSGATGFPDPSAFRHDQSPRSLMDSHSRNNRGRSGSSNLRNSMMPFRFPQRWGERSSACHT